MSIVTPCFRIFLKHARRIFLENYKWYKLEPTKQQLQIFIDSWIELQYAKIHEKKR